LHWQRQQVQAQDACQAEQAAIKYYQAQVAAVTAQLRAYESWRPSKPTLQPKSDLSDFGRQTEPNSGKHY
jgi:hypothetical protein